MNKEPRNSSETSSAPQTGRHAVDQLIEEAGARVDPPLEHLEQIRSVAKSEWRRNYTAKLENPPTGSAGHPSSSRAFLWLAAAAALLISSGVFWWPRPAEDVVSAVVVSLPEVLSVRGGVLVDGSGGRAAVGARLSLGTELRLDPKAHVAIASLRLGSGHSLRISENSRVRFLDGGRLKLLSGKIYLASPDFRSRSDQDRVGGVMIETDLGTVREIGTQFEVALVKDSTGMRRLSARVREGEVVVQVTSEDPSWGSTASAKAGEQLLSGEDGAIIRSEIAVYGERWQWVLAGAEPFPIDGRSASDLLSWLARETGRQVVYQSPAVVKAAQVRFSGRVLVNVADALDVLRTVHLVATFEDGKILVAEI